VELERRRLREQPDPQISGAFHDFSQASDAVFVSIFGVLPGCKGAGECLKSFADRTVAP